MFDDILFLAVILVSFTIQALTGFGGPLIAMPLGIAIIGVATAKPVITLAAWLTSVIIAVRHWRDIDFKELAKMAGIMLAFMIAGIWIFKSVKMSYLQVIYGIIVILIGLKKLLMPSERKMPQWLAVVAICLAGIMQGMFVSGGSFLVVYAVSAISEKQKFRATMSSVWAVVNIFLLVSYAVDGSFAIPVLTMSAWALIPIIAATVLGGILVKHLDQKTFLKVAYILLIISGAILLITNI